MLEFFLNYDCEMNKLNIIEKLFETLSKISQGKYSKQEFSTILQPNQELSLRTQVLESPLKNYSSLLKNLGKIIRNESFGIQKPYDFNIFKRLFHGSYEHFNGKLELFREIESDETGNRETIIKFNNKPELGVKNVISIGFLEPKE